MIFLYILRYIFVITAFMGIIYKSQYHRKALNIDKLPKAVFWMNKFFMLNLMLPLRKRPHNDLDNIERKKANTALLTFYVSFILVLLLSKLIK